ncbi:AAA family ATPase [Acuticoccus sp.]|uniref:AAA family ATPase n=1 Tax=Acuticoccus sp. TaxID=1904378 RepID=UPI003B52DD25
MLADADHESALQEDALAPYIGRLSREVFSRAFGLNSERLRRGADEMLHPGGEIGAVMMAAAAGLTGLTALSTTLESEAEELYGPKKSKRRFYQAQNRHNDAASAERDGDTQRGRLARTW